MDQFSMTALNRPASKFPFAAWLFLAPGLLLLALSAREIGESDTWWHLKTGELIVTQQHLPQTDPFSEANAEKPWVNFEWLSQVVFYLAYPLAGPAGLVVGSMLALGLAGPGPGSACSFSSRTRSRS
jgi:hypothetical protein